MACITPVHIRNKLSNEWQVFPCGKCPPCLKRRISGWSFRLRKEEERCNSAAFITLTYNTDHVPITDNGFMTLRKTDVQLFMKRLRKLNKDKLRYYVCGEYGSQFGRPHYHYILFNCDLTTIELAWVKDGRSIGNVYFGTVTGASIGYVLKYMSKPGRIPQHKRDDREKEFQLVSKD